MSDLVERLRNCCSVESGDPECCCAEAADEMLRLRVALEEIAREFATSHPNVALVARRALKD